MENQLFVIGSDNLQHVFGGIAKGSDMLEAISVGIDYGGVGFNINGEVGKQNGARYVMILPVSGRTARRFEKIVGGLQALDKVDRLPIYFSQDLRFNPWFEQEGATPLELDGNECQDAGQDRFYPRERSDFLVTANSGFTTDPVLMHPPGLRWVRANCLTCFNAVVHFAGIDLPQLQPGLWSMRRGLEFTKMFRDQFERASVLQACETWPGYQIKALDLPSGHQAMLVESQPVKDRETGEEKIVAAAYNHVRIAAEFCGGFKELWRRAQSWRPFDTDPLPIPAYLRAEFDRCEIEIA